MSLRRVVVTGTGAVSPFGKGSDILIESLRQGKTGVRAIPELGRIGGIRSGVAALVRDVDGKEIPRKWRRTMSKMSIYATLASKEALESAGLTKACLSDGAMGVAIGSTLGSIDAIEAFFSDYLLHRTVERMKSGLFFQVMNHSCAANVSQALGINGRMLAPSAACSTGCQGVGYAYEMIVSGKQDYVISGGAEEYHPLSTATFDMMNAASIRYNSRPELTPRPFDRQRDGVVCAEGSGILLLESMESARKRGARMLAEVVGFATIATPSGMAAPSTESMELCMRKALAEAHVEPEEVDYVNAHATATEQGDVAECEAIHRVFGNHVRVSSLKGHLGHTMAASGALELVATVWMMRHGYVIPTLNLETIDPACKRVRHVRMLEKARVSTSIKNNFAFGGVNSSIVLRRCEDD
jgi:3-oxoacyl-[acyl-carrier-protein] synthase II